MCEFLAVRKSYKIALHFTPRIAKGKQAKSGCCSSFTFASRVFRRAGTTWNTEVFGGRIGYVRDHPLGVLQHRTYDNDTHSCKKLGLWAESRYICWTSKDAERKCAYMLYIGLRGVNVYHNGARARAPLSFTRVYTYILRGYNIQFEFWIFRCASLRAPHKLRFPTEFISFARFFHPKITQNVRYQHLHKGVMTL